MTDPSRATERVVWGGWGLLTAAALVLVAVFGRNVPYWDDWKLVPVLLGGQPPSLAWIWEQGNEHRLPLAKAVLLALASLSGGDLRWAMLASALLLCALPVMLLSAVRRLAGRWAWTDLLLPVALLNWGHQINVLWQIQLHFVLAVALFTGSLVVLLHLVAPPAGAPPDGPRSRAPWALLAVALPLPFASGIGLCLAPVLVLWMAWAAPRVPERPMRRALWTCAALLAAAVALLVASLPSSPASDVGFAGLGATAATTLRCLSTALGPVGRELWPWSGLIVALLGAASALLLLSTVRREPERRLGASVLLAGLLAVFGLALVIGRSRAGLGWEAGFAPRYTTLMAPGLCCAYLAWRLHGGALARRVPALLCVALLLALPFNTALGLRDARRYAADLEAFAADLRAGVAPAEAVRVHGPRICPAEGERRVASDLQLMRQRRLWLFRAAD